MQSESRRIRQLRVENGVLWLESDLHWTRAAIHAQRCRKRRVQSRARRHSSHAAQNRDGGQVREQPELFEPRAALSDAVAERGQYAV